jgi:hypothetical protein
MDNAMGYEELKKELKRLEVTIRLYREQGHVAVTAWPHNTDQQVKDAFIKFNKRIFNEEVANYGQRFVEQDNRPATWVDTSSLCIDGSYQRPLQPTHVLNMIKNFDHRLMDPLVVNLRDDGKFYVIDGQHRLEVARRSGIKRLLCVIYENESTEREAYLFWYYNGRLGTKAINNKAGMRSRIIAGDVLALTLTRILKESGFEWDLVGGSESKNKIGAIAAVEKIYKTRGEKTLKRALVVLKNVPAGSVGGKNSGLLLQGIALVIDTYDHVVGFDEELTRRLNVTGTDYISQVAVRNSTLFGIGPLTATAAALVDTYNTRKVNKIDKTLLVGAQKM